MFRVHLDPVPRSLSGAASGLKSRLYRIERGVHLYQIAAPDGHSPIKFHYSAPGFKPLETSLTPQPGERQDLIFHFAPTDSTDESRVILSRDAPSSAIEASPEGHTQAVTRVIFTPGDRQLLSGSLDRTVRLWDVPK